MVKVIRKKNFLEKLKAFGLRKVASVFVLVVLVIGTGVTYYELHQQQDIRQQAAGPTTSTSYSLTLNQTAPSFGSVIDFTAVYPKEATRKVGVDQHWNPDVQVWCYQNGTMVLSQVVVFLKDSQNGDGNLTGVSSSLTLSSNGGNGITPWTSGAANCSAILYYFGHDFQIHILAQISFDVSP